MKRWPLNKAYFWETYPFFRLLLPIVAGIALYPQRPHTENFLYCLLALAGISAATYVAVATGRQNNPKKFTRFVSLHVALFTIAWLLCYFQDIRNNKHWFGHTTDKAGSYVVQLKSAPIEKDKTWKLDVEVLASISGEVVTPARGQAFIYTYKYNTPALREGDIIILPNNWQPITNRGNPFEFDYAGYCARDNIFYQQFISGDDISIHKYATSSELPLIRRIHHWCITQLEWHIRDRRVSGLLKAMLIGNKEALDEELTNAYAETGIVHIMAISGAHITVFFVLAAFLLSWIRHRKYYWVKYIAAIPLIWLYVVVAGAPASAVRAATMFSLLGMGFALQKQPNGINQLLATAFILLCLNPSWLFAIGFQLSFVAVLSIFIFYRPVYRLLSPANKLLRSLWAAVAVSIAAEILVAPLVIYYFHLFPLQFIVANVLAYIFMSILLIAGLVLIAIAPIYQVASLLGSGITWVTTFFNDIIYRLQLFNFKSFHALTLSEIQLTLLYLTITFLAIFLIRKNRKALIPGLIAATALLAVFCVSWWHTLHQQIFIVYNTNKDDYIEVIEGRKAMVLHQPKEVDDKTRKYVIDPAHIGYHVNHTEQLNEASELITIKGKTILILNSPSQITRAQADYVILNYRAKVGDLGNIQNNIQPELLVIGSNLSGNKTGQIIAEAEKLGMRVHNIHTEGAFIVK